MVSSENPESLLEGDSYVQTAFHVSVDFYDAPSFLG